MCHLNLSTDYKFKKNIAEYAVSPLFARYKNTKTGQTHIVSFDERGCLRPSDLNPSVFLATEHNYKKIKSFYNDLVWHKPEAKGSELTKCILRHAKYWPCKTSNISEDSAGIGCVLLVTLKDNAFFSSEHIKWKYAVAMNPFTNKAITSYDEFINIFERGISNAIATH